MSAGLAADSRRRRSIPGSSPDEAACLPETGSSEKSRVEQLVDQILERLIDAVSQTLDRRPALRMRRNVVHILTLDARVPDLLRIEHDVRPGLAAPEAHVGFHINVARSRQLLAQLLEQLFGATLLAIFVLTDENVTARHFLYRQHPVSLFEK